MKIESIKKLINQVSYREYLDSLNSILINKKNRLIDQIDDLISSDKFLYECGISQDGQYGIGIVIPAVWESEVIGKKCAKLFILNGSNYLISNQIIKNLHQQIGKQLYWIQYDSQLSEPYVEIALENFGYHIGTQYYQWIGIVENLNMKMINFADRFDTILATKKDAEEIKSFTRKFPDPGRFVIDPFLREDGKKLYSSWAFNSCVIESDSEKILLCKEGGKIIGYETITFNSHKEANLGILRINSDYKGKLLGFGILVSSIKLCIDNGINAINTRTSKFNIDVNKIYKSLGFSISESSIQFHWVNKELFQS